MGRGSGGRAPSPTSWIAGEWLDKDDRLRASIVVNLGRPESAAGEIDRVAADRRFVQVIVPVQTEMPLGRSIHKPIPPSILTVVLAILANAAVAQLLIAGTLPGCLLAVLYIAYAYVRVLIDPSKAPPLDTSIRRTLRDGVRGLWRMFPFAFVMFMVIGLMIMGIASPTESAAPGVASWFVSARWSRTLSWKMIWTSLQGAAKIAEHPASE